MFLSVGSILATLIFKILEYFQKLPKHHIICLIMVYIGAVGCFVMAFMHTMISQCIMYLTFGVFCFFVIVVIDICLVRAAPSGEIGMWVGFSHGAFGVGALIGPLLVPIFEIKLFIILAIAFAIVGPFFYFLRSPSGRTTKRLKINLKTKIKRRIFKDIGNYLISILHHCWNLSNYSCMGSHLRSKKWNQY